MPPSLRSMLSGFPAATTLFLLLSFFTPAIHADEPMIHSELLVTYEDMNVVLLVLHEFWPPWESPPPSNISGLTNDECRGTGDCVPPRVCNNCEGPVCPCVTPSVYERFSCRSTKDCDLGEFCVWEPLIGMTAGKCLSSLAYRNMYLPILSEPIKSEPPLLGLGLTGDRCFFHTDCRGARSCLGEAGYTNELHNVTTCERSAFPCVCTPIKFVPCSSTFRCPEQDEVCASLMMSLGLLFSFLHMQELGGAQLEPLCISRSLVGNEYVKPVSAISNISEVPELPVARLQPRIFKPKKLPLSPDRIHPDLPPFSVPELSFFNSFSTNDLGNDFIGGILSLIIVSQLHKILQSLIYSTPGIKQEAYSSYIIFSRFSSFRHLLRTFTGNEPNNRSMNVRSNRRRNQLKLKRVLLPFTAFVLFFAVEIGCIIAGTNTRQEYYAEQNFDPIVAAINGTRRPRIQDRSKEYCDDFLVPTRGLFRSGKVLKCVRPISVPNDFVIRFTDVILVLVYFGSGKTIFEIYSQHGGAQAVELSTYVRSESGVNLRTMPFRPDLMNQYDRITLLNGVMNGIRNRLGYEEQDVESFLWSSYAERDESGRVDTWKFGYRPNWNDSLEEITEAVVLGLRDLDLVLNSTGQPWIYTKPYTFERLNPLMAIVKPYRISHAWLTIAAIVVTAVHIILNTFVTSFDDVAYVAMKELIGDDCVLGPLAETYVETEAVEL